MIYMLRKNNAIETPTTTYCVNWSAANIDNIRISTEGYIDFTTILAGRTIADSPISTGNVTGYIIAGETLVRPCSIEMDFTSVRATWSYSSLPPVTDKVISSLIYSVEIICTNSDELPPIYNEQTNAVVTSGQTTSSYNSCV